MFFCVNSAFYNIVEVFTPRPYWLNVEQARITPTPTSKAMFGISHIKHVCNLNDIAHQVWIEHKKFRSLPVAWLPPPTPGHTLVAISIIYMC